jgi:type VI protein secretion system component VasK
MARRDGWFGWQQSLVALAAIAAVLVLVNIVLFEMNRGLQAEVSARAQYIQQTVQFEALNREMVNAIANLAARNNDDALRTVLSQHGIAIGSTAAPPPAAPAAPSGKR